MGWEAACVSERVCVCWGLVMKVVRTTGDLSARRIAPERGCGRTRAEKVCRRRSSCLPGGLSSAADTDRQRIREQVL